MPDSATEQTPEGPQNTRNRVTAHGGAAPPVWTWTLRQGFGARPTSRK